MVLQGICASPMRVSGWSMARSSVSGRLDVLVNMASVYTAVPFDELTVEMWDTQLDVDLRAALVVRARCGAAHEAAARRAHHQLRRLAGAERPTQYEGYLTYYVAKAGVAALTEALALELAKDQILVNAIAPGPIVAPEDTSDETFAAVERATPLGRWGGEGEIAKMVLALDRQRLRHWGDDSGRRRKASEITQLASRLD